MFFMEREAKLSAHYHHMIAFNLISSTMKEVRDHMQYFVIKIYTLCTHYCLGESVIQSKKNVFTIMILSFQTDRAGQTVQTQIRLLLYQGLHCLLFHWHLLD